MNKGGHLSIEQRHDISERMKGANNHRYGKPVSKETRLKLSIAGKGKIRSGETRHKLSESKKGPKHPLYGKQLSEEHRVKISKGNKGKISKNHVTGDNHPFWKGGISKHPDYKRFRESQRRINKQNNGGSFTIGEWELLKEQYGYKCPICGKLEPEIELTIDHIIPVSKGGVNDISNIQPLCKPCNSHKRTRVFRINPDGELRLF